MTDMTAEQIWRDVDGIERRIACNEIGAPAAFTLMKQLVSQAMTAPRVPDGWMLDLMRIHDELLCFSTYPESYPFEAMKGHLSILQRKMSELLTAATAPAEPFKHSAELQASRRNGLPKPAPADDLASPQFVELTRLRQKSAGDDAELATLRERVKELESDKQRILERSLRGGSDE